MNLNNNIAVIMATYNGEKYVKQQIESILNQIDVNVKIFLFDDRSSDNTLKIVSENFSKNQVECILNTKASGSAALNFFNAILSIDENSIKNYSYISLADQDDIWLPQKLVKASETMVSNNVSLYASNLTQWIEGTNKRTTIKKSYKQKKYDYLFEGGSAGCTYVFNKEVFFELKKTLSKIDLDDWKQLSHDWFIYFLCRNKNLKVFIDKKSYILYRLHENNVHGQLNSFSLYAVKNKIKMVRNGWYINNIKGFSQLVLNDQKINKIYSGYSKNVFSRMYVILIFNTNLMRDFKKFIIFSLISLIPIKK